MKDLDNTYSEFKPDTSNLELCHAKLLAEVFNESDYDTCSRKASAEVARSQISPNLPDGMKHAVSEIIDGIYSGDGELISRGVMQSKNEEGGLKRATEEVQHVVGSVGPNKRLEIMTSKNGDLQIETQNFGVQVESKTGDRIALDWSGKPSDGLSSGLLKSIRDVAVVEMNIKLGNGILRDRWE